MPTIKKIGKFIASRALYLALGVFLAVGATYVYAAWDTKIVPNSSTPLTSALWNDVINKLVELDNKPTLQMKTGTYTGNGVDNRNIDIGVDLQNAEYKYIIIRATTIIHPAMMKFGHDTGDVSKYFSDGFAVVNFIQAWTTTGFQIGTTPEVNANAYGYNYIVFWQK